MTAFSRKGRNRGDFQFLHHTILQYSDLSILVQITRYQPTIRGVCTTKFFLSFALKLLNLHD